jgi:hypothetical protein
MQIVHLQGAESVERAGQQISEAATRIERAVSNFTNALEENNHRMENWIEQVRELLKEQGKS